MYCSTCSRMYPIFSLGIIDLLKITMYVCVCISSPTFLMVILLKSVTPCFLMAVFISSGVAKDNSLFLITPFEVFHVSCG